MSFDISILTDLSNGKLKALKDAADELRTAIVYREDEIEDIGVNNEYEIAYMLMSEIENMTKTLNTWKYKLQTIHYGKGPTGNNPTGTWGP